jgi:hypothetical protein
VLLKYVAGMYTYFIILYLNNFYLFAILFRFLFYGIFVKSNFSIVIRATDGTLWAMGMGEYDRNGVSVPTTVLSPINPNIDHGQISSNNNTSQDIPFIATSDSQMKKGNKRVSLVTHSIDGNALKDNAINHSWLCSEIYDVILHNFEAYLKPVDLTFQQNSVPSQKTEIDKTRKYRITDYSSGWMHSLLALEDLDSTNRSKTE